MNMADGDEAPTVGGSPRVDTGQVSGTSTASTPDEVRIDSSKQTVPVLKGTFPSADDVEQWSMGFEAALSILNLGEVLEQVLHQFDADGVQPDHGLVDDDYLRVVQQGSGLEELHRAGGPDPFGHPAALWRRCRARS